MPYCSAVGCSSDSSRKRGESFSFHLFPKNVADARVWYARCGKDLHVSVDKFNPALFRNRLFLCSKHFSPSDFTTETKEKLGFKVKRKLKEGALPTLFSRQSTSSKSMTKASCSSFTTNRRTAIIKRTTKKESQEIITSSTDIPSAAGNHGTNGKPRMELNTQDVSACIGKPPLLIRMPAPQKSSGSKKAKKQIKKTLPGLEVSTSKRPPSKRMKKVARILQPDEHMLLEALSLQTSAYQRKFKIDNSLPKVTYQQTTEEVIFLNEDKFSPVSTAPVTTVVKQENGINHPSSSDIGNKNINLCYCDQELKIEADYEDNSLHELQFIEAYQELHRTSSSVEYVPISNIKVEDSENSSAEVKGQVGLMDTSDSVSANCCHREVVHVKTAKAADNYMKHDSSFKTHSGYYCSECGKKFRSKNILDRHLMVHTSEVLYHCSQCDKQFKGEDRLCAHLTFHEAERLYSCPECDERYSQYESLEKHMETHDVFF